MKEGDKPRPAEKGLRLSVKVRLPGHHAPQPIRRRAVGSDLEYVDDDVDTAAFQWAFDYGFSLSDFDDWLESADMPADFCRQLLEFRQRALDAQRANNEDAVDAWVLLLRLFLQRRGEHEVLIPAAQSDARYRQAQSERGRLSAKLTESDRRRMVEQYELRVRDGQRYGAIKALAAAFDVSERTVCTIVAPKRNRK